uniref:Uncharacterized protein n=1 Tax=Oryza punctata TaxID=4537 RepID=A0A0E0KB70_ORYPU
MREYMLGLHFALRPASRGVLFLQFSSITDRDAAVEFGGTLEAEEHILVLEKPEENESRSHQPLTKLSELEVTDWPPEHRLPENGDIGIAKIEVISTRDANQNFDEDDNYIHHFPLMVLPHMSRPHIPPQLYNNGQHQNSPHGGAPHHHNHF